jgi:hypothetical protein
MAATLTPLGRRVLEHIERQAQVVEPRAAKSLSFLTAGQFLAKDYRQTFLIERILTQGEPAIIGGPPKTLKTSLAIDMAVSLASGKPFLDMFNVPHAVPVGVISGESGGPTIKNLFRRICQTRGVDRPGSLPMSFLLDLPSLQDAAEMDAVCREVQQRGMRIVFLDPLYLLLIANGGKTNTANLYEVGPVLGELCRRFLDVGATPVLIHHFRKQSAGMPELHALSGAGVAEFARQWLLLGLRKRFDAETGKHSLWMHVGGSAGHGGAWAVDVREGVMDERFCGRRWDIEVRTEAEERQRDDDEPKGKTSRLHNAEERLLAVLRQHPDGETQSGLLEVTGLRHDVIKPVIDKLLEEGRIEECTVLKPFGRGRRGHDGFRLVQKCTLDSTAPDEDEDLDLEEEEDDDSPEDDMDD